MNIFFFHQRPSVCAKMHPDQLVVKMILEYLQILYTVVYQRYGEQKLWIEYWEESCSFFNVSPTVGDSEISRPYKMTHVKHPSVIWVCSTFANTRWLLELALCLCEEFTFRNKKHHKCEPHITVLSKLFLDKENIRIMWPDTPRGKSLSIEPLLLAMHDPIRNEYGDYTIDEERRVLLCRAKTVKDSVLAYRKYIIELKDYATWRKGRGRPTWMIRGMLWSTEKKNEYTTMKKVKDRLISKLLDLNPVFGKGSNKRKIPISFARKNVLNLAKCTTIKQVVSYSVLFE